MRSASVPSSEVTISVVSHGQNALVNQLLGDISAACPPSLDILVTQNIADRTPLAAMDMVREIIVNPTPKGFGANHNAAFARCRSEFFCVVNPDIRIRSDPLPSLRRALASERAGVAGPLVRTPAGRVEDSARRFPTLPRLVAKAFRDERSPDYPIDRGPIAVDWIAGMFMLFRSETYRRIGGFDEAYFLYYEDVDLCLRLRNRGFRVIFEPLAEVVHDARRASRRNPRLALRHAASMLRFLSRSARSSLKSLESSSPHMK